MLISKLKITAFGKFIDKTIDFTNGLNIIYGDNEAGKSTTHAFIRAMLFGMKKKKNKVNSDLYQKYYPWNSKNLYGGSLTFIYNDNTYEISREFNLTNPSLEIHDLSNSNKLIDDPELFLSSILHNINSETFDNTISVRQLKSAQDISIVDELHKIIANLNTSGDMSIDTLYAINYLSHKKEKLLQNIDNDATIIYNRQLGNIRNLEKELSSQKYENKLAGIISRKNIESKKINDNNIEIDNLKKEVAEKLLILNKYGFNDTKDINSLSNEVNKIYIDYKPISKSSESKYSNLIYILSIVAGIVLIIISLLFLVATYPDIASILNLHDTRYSMNGITNFIVNLPFHPIILIGFLLCIGLILLFGGIVLLINNIKSKSTSNELKNILSDIFTQQIDSEIVDENNYIKFKKHIRNMKSISKVVNDFETRIVVLTEENNKLLEEQTKYLDIIKSQQKIQYDVDQKYIELYKLRDENEKTKLSLANNDSINTEVESINLAIETIKTLSNEIQVSFGTHLNDTASKYIAILTNNKYTSLNVDNSLNVTINFEGRMIPLELTSTGTIDQIYLALRLAITDIINNNENFLPMIFDDCFAMYDNNRLMATLRFLSNLTTQIIVFTCHTREKEIVNVDNIKSNVIDIDDI